MSNSPNNTDRRLFPRFDAQLKAYLRGILIYSAGADTAREQNLLSIPCYTRDVSEVGLSLVVPNESIDEKLLPAEGCLILVMLEIPAGRVALEARPLHFRLMDENPERGYLIGAQITQISENDRAQYQSYLEGL